jgi:hypothetical protein
MRDLGDYQTPPALVSAVLARLWADGGPWRRVLEPTCGRGHFLDGLLALDPAPAELVGVEVQPGHLEAAKRVAQKSGSARHVSLTCADLFSLDLSSQLGWRGGGSLLVVGNPPWVTNAALGAMGSTRRPPRSNVKEARGIEAITGSSNFDVAEAVWLKLLSELASEEPTIALLCKTAVARKVLEHAAKTGLPVADAAVFQIDARAMFEAEVEACLLRVRLGRSAPRNGLLRIPVFDSLAATEPSAEMGLARGRLVANVDVYARYAFLDGVCPLVWRQGLKHDVARIMELVEEPDGTLRNGLDEPVEVERGYVYPLLKCSDLARPEFSRTTKLRRVLVTQRSVSEDTHRLSFQTPRLWAYLQRHAAAFARRRSSVYRGRPPFAMFGVGPYTFAPYKVAVSGLHKKPLFRAIGSRSTGLPVMLDDTCYFLACRSPEQAGLASALLNSPDALGFLASLQFPGTKRPVTKAVLQRVDLFALLNACERNALLERAGAEVERLGGASLDWPEDLGTVLEGGPENCHHLMTVTP